MADRYSYIPLMGVFVVFAWGLGELVSYVPATQKAVCVTAAIGLMALVWLTVAQIGVWRDSFSLFSHAAAVTSRNSEAEDNLGSWFLNQGRLDDALAHYSAAVGFEPNSYSALEHVGITLFRQGHVPEARNYLEASLRAYPGWSEAHFYLASLLTAQGNLEAAIANYRAALQTDPANAQTHDQLGKVLARQGNIREALAQFEEAIRLEPENFEPHYDAALALVILGIPEAAIKSYRETIRLRPDWPVALNDLAWLLATHPRPEIRNGAEAVRFAERACQLSQQREASYLGTLDAAYAEMGRFKDAIATAQLAQTRASGAGQKDVAAAAKARIELYRAGKPFRQ